MVGGLGTHVGAHTWELADMIGTVDHMESGLRQEFGHNATILVVPQASQQTTPKTTRKIWGKRTLVEGKTTPVVRRCAPTPGTLDQRAIRHWGFECGRAPCF